MKGKLQHGIYVMLVSSFRGWMFVSHSLEEHLDNTKLWHHRLGHMSERGLDVLSKEGLLGGVVAWKLNFCESCVMGKQRRLKFSHGKHTSIEILQLFILIYGVLLMFCPMEDASILWRLLMTTLERFGCIFWRPGMKCLDDSRSGRLLLRNKLGN